MTNSLLRSLRDRALDESEPLAGLLRKCLLLGAETGSSALRDWARLELNGYPDKASVPDYRIIASVPMVMDSLSGNYWTKGQTVTRFQFPEGPQKYVDEELHLTQPIEELERLAQGDSLSVTTAGLSVAQAMWNREISPYQSIVNLSFTLSGSVIAGILGQVRTKLVDLIADLTTTTPLTELPRREDVDAAMQQRIGHVGDVYTTTVVKPTGPVAIGASATATAGISIDETLALLDAVRAAATAAPDDTKELEDALADLQEVIVKPQPDTGEVVKQAGKLRAVAEKLGVTAVSSATGAAVTALTNLAMQGAFG